MERFSSPATVVSNCLSVSKESGTPSVKITVRTSLPDGKVVTLIGDMWLTYKTAVKTRETLEKVFGFMMTDDLALLNEPLLAGHKCEVVVETEIWQGQDRLKIAFFNRAKTPTKLSQEDLAAFLKQTGEVFAAVQRDMAKVPSAQNATQVAAAAANDLPF